MTNLGSSDNPLEHYATELSFEPLTSDPEDTQTGEMWLRTDLDNEVEYQIATLRFDNGDILDIPVYETNANLFDDYDPILGVNIDGERGFVPLSDPEEATFPQLAFQHNQRYGWNTLQEPSAIPDSVVSRPDDNNSTSTDTPFGIQISVKRDWPDFIDVELSDNGSDRTRAYIYRFSDAELVVDKDISDLSSGDQFRFELSDPLDPDEEYNIIADAEGSSYTSGFYDDASFPYESDDIDIIDGAAREDEGDPNPHNFVKVGNLELD